MTLTEMQKELGLEAIPDVWCELFDEAQKNVKVLFDYNRITDIIDTYAIFTKYREDVLCAARELAEDEAAALYVSLVETAMRRGRSSEMTVSDIRNDTLRGRFALLFPHLINVPNSVKFLRDHGINEEMISGTLYEFERSVSLHETRTGVSGLLLSSFSWLKLIYENRLVRVGNLNFEMRKFTDRVKAFKNKSGEIKLLSEDLKIHQSGRPLGAALCTDEEGSFDALFSETETEYIGNPINKNGETERERIHLSKNEWELVLQSGDPVLGVHIPTGISLSEELCEQSYELCRTTFKNCFPEFKFKAFSCFSWMLYKGLEPLSKPNSNLVKFLNKFIPFQRRAPGVGIFVFVYMLDPKIDIKTIDYNTLPENTSLQRSIKQHYINGGRVYEDGGIFF